MHRVAAAAPVPRQDGGVRVQALGHWQPRLDVPRRWCEEESAPSGPHEAGDLRGGATYLLLGRWAGAQGLFERRRHGWVRWKGIESRRDCHRLGRGGRHGLRPDCELVGSALGRRGHVQGRLVPGDCVDVPRPHHRDAVSAARPRGEDSAARPSVQGVRRRRRGSERPGVLVRARMRGSLPRRPVAGSCPKVTGMGGDGKAAEYVPRTWRHLQAVPRRWANRFFFHE
mmetsp:Transcript_65038/g.198889  ORF Transcript_65038/g.198889 Transcript_65038/m.198889 type:complete len:227 (+) Transcript_65038:1217-1897(+)